MDFEKLTDTVIIFDLDGTLVDSARDLSRTLNYVLEREGLPPVPPALTGFLVGQGANAMMAAGFETAGRPYPAPGTDERDRLFSMFIDHYREHIADHTVVFPGAQDQLEALVTNNVALAVCTNKQTDLAQLLLEQLGIASLFRETLGRDAVARPKPSSDPLIEILRRTGKTNGIMVGDSYTDRDAARAASMPCLLVTHGYGTLDEPLADNERLFSHFNDLQGVLASVIK